jgi:hypothetical protein
VRAHFRCLTACLLSHCIEAFVYPQLADAKDAALLPEALQQRTTRTASLVSRIVRECQQVAFMHSPTCVRILTSHERCLYLTTRPPIAKAGVLPADRIPALVEGSAARAEATYYRDLCVKVSGV